MKIIDLSMKRETENYKFFYIQYTVWYQPNKIKERHGFVIKSNSDCHWSDTGRRLSARLEIAVLACIEGEEHTLASMGEDEYFKRVWNAQVHQQQKGDTFGTSPTIKPKEEISDIRKIIYSRIENIQEP